jgi:hypothetical protein
MTIKSIKEKSSKIELDLTGPEGNAYVILGCAQKLAKQLNLNWEEINTKMTFSNYENLINVFEEYFGNYVTMYR